MSAESVVFRSPLASDYLALSSWIDNARDCARWAGPQLAFPFTPAELPALLQMSAGASVAMVNEQAHLLAFGQYWLRPEGTVHLGRIIVSPQARGRGLAEQLCRWLIAEGQAQTGVQVASLRVYRDNPAAMRVYERLGFVPVEAESNAEILFMQRTAG